MEKRKPRKDKNLMIRVQAEERLAFTQAAKLAGLGTSAWVRERLRLAAIRELEGAGIRVPFVSRVALREIPHD
jgi:hypothetical protein